LDLEQQKTKSTLKDSADLETTKLAKLGKLSDKHGLKVSELQIAFKANKKAAVTDLSLQKKIYKKELKFKNDLALSKVRAQINISKDVKSSKKILQKKFEAQAKTLQLLQKAFAESKRQSFKLSADIMSVSKAKALFKEDIKVLDNTIKSLTSKVDNHLVHKNAHDSKMQKMKNNYKQLGLNKLREKLTNKKVGGATSNGSMSLEHKKDFVMHQACETGEQESQSCSCFPAKRDKKEGHSVKP
jgi:hypothetical protein